MCIFVGKIAVSFEPIMPFIILHDLECPNSVAISLFYDILRFPVLFSRRCAIMAAEERDHLLLGNLLMDNGVCRAAKYLFCWVLF